MPYKNKEDQRAQNARYHAEYDKRPEVKVKISEAKKRRTKRNKEFAMSLMTPCISCGYFDPVVMDFHHLDKSQKENGVSKLIQNNSSLEKIKSEIDKCVCLCSNCHRKVHGGTLTIIQ